MAKWDLAIGLIFLTQTTVGILGNFSLLCHYIILSFTEYRWRSTDFIHKHLIGANFLALVCKGVPQTMAAFGRKHFLSDIGCKLLLFLHRVGRGVSIGSICTLSVYQAITIRPGNSRWAELKVKAPKYIVPSIFLCWVLQMLVNIIFPIYLTSTLNDKNITDKKDFGYCSSVRHDKTSDSLYGLLLSFPDVLCLGLMLWASSSMVFLLYRHKQRVQHIRGTNASSRTSPESRATKTILLLVSTFVYFYTLSSIFQLVMSLFDNPSLILVNVAAVVSVCFPTVSPFLLMSDNSKVPKVPRLCFAWRRNIRPPCLMKNM
ncbi:vomeronasal type-1 receptor 4-like [Neofelis nebulosa]|uniref:Vomeronasal type-1 receptor n=1 Tax=Neofelis nebulosa TaxID=61452 RepID=A0A0A0Y872_NEONE|nr:vomeronasal type-1 receptor 4-like [Neofelis nebulosa]AIX03318.1 vomeronasal receptor type I [Neofelis nebulosa]